ncbi:cytosolic Fe-S cluster assembly factor nar1-like [Teratosphaeria destructans]|uniref:Nuclear architecture-related protein 1 n=1 Tax=Teratosphaeria destructans TaxID=418781 RepID=A0A9W7SR96_9PEZI|nr:cytosolic Fe-S cluster assembly factor nar1-like [Teratosphaeria destructans]
MSAILSADDLNDFINPGVACIKPVETLPQQQPQHDDGNPYEVTTEDKITAVNPPPAQISLTDCLACSGCVTSAEAVLVSLQSHSEVLDTLDKHGELRLDEGDGEGRIFVASVSPQTRASLAATYGVSEREAGNMINQLLSGPYGLRSSGQKKSGFTWVVDTNVMREVVLVAAAEEVLQSGSHGVKKPVLTSACPGWICYAEKTHPHILPHLSKLKSPQALTGTLLKSVLTKKFGVPPEKIWHLAVMPCFDKKLEASRAELTSHAWHGQGSDAVRDVDCVITARELLMLAESRNISFPCLPKTPVSTQMAPPIPDSTINAFVLERQRGQKRKRDVPEYEIGTSGGYLYHVLKTQQALHPGSQLTIQRGRNADVSEYTVTSPSGEPVFKAARYYGFRNIQNLVRRLKPAKQSRMPGAAVRRPGGARKPAFGGSESDYAYVEVMACPGGCTNGGGQIKVGDVATLRQVGGTGVENGSLDQYVLPAQREWLTKVDEAYWSADDGSASSAEDVDSDGDSEMKVDSVVDGEDDAGSADVVDGIDRRKVMAFLEHWTNVTGVDLSRLVETTYRVVESDVGKNGAEKSEVEKVSALAVAAGGGW